MKRPNYRPIIIVCTTGVVYPQSSNIKTGHLVRGSIFAANSIHIMSPADLKKMCSQVRRDIVRMVHAVNSGHPGGSLGCTEFFVALYFDKMRLDPANWNMDGIGEDLFFLSNGHISPVWYSVLSRRGYFPVEELKTFRKLDSRLQGH